MSRRKILVADLLCGAGGSSTGCERALAQLGLEMELVCLNHWPTAIETHQKNHPKARHYCQDIATVRPHLIVPEGHLDLLMASPTCTHHSVARGGKPTSVGNAVSVAMMKAEVLAIMADAAVPARAGKRKAAGQPQKAVAA